MPVQFGLNAGAYMNVTAPTIVTLTPLAPGETFPAGMTVIPTVEPPTTPTPTATTTTTPVAAAESTSATPPLWQVTFTEKR